ncbi:FUSC family protein [Polaribacter sp.]|uniref:FUSC family protein n=1 Tax=Polaribacter sp. TaxID=1920175 RepID=UPI0040473364
MKPEEIAKLTDQELSYEFKKIKPSPIFDAFFIGLMIGIIIFSIAKNTLGLVSLIPLFLIYLFLKKSKTQKALSEELKNRNLSKNS